MNLRQTWPLLPAPTPCPLHQAALRVRHHHGASHTPPTRPQLHRLHAQLGSSKQTENIKQARAAEISTEPPKAQPFEQESKPSEPPANLGYIWALVVLSLSYLHHSTTGFALPAMLPLISPDLKLSDSQGALLTVGYTVLYAAALIPVGFIADRADRPRLLAFGAAMWSVLTMAASKVTDFQGLLLLRVGLATAQAAQNPVCFSIIPELFPRRRNLAMSAYNSAIYAGRALSYGAVLLAAKLTAARGTGEVGVTLVPLDSLDLSIVSILYTSGDMAAITNQYQYDFTILHSTITVSSWRELLYWLGPPGLVIAAMILLTVVEPRKKNGGLLGAVASSSKFAAASSLDDAPEASSNGNGAALRRQQAEQAEQAERASSGQQASSSGQGSGPDLGSSVKELLSSRAFQALTAAAAINDIGSWALVSWQATFYQRVYQVGPDVYAPALAALLPIGGLVGGVGGGLLADKLSRLGATSWLTSGATMVAAPVIVCNLLAPEYNQSLIALLIGFALSEMWRAPAAVMVRDVSPPSLGSTGSAVHLCIRNLIGGLGPLWVSMLAERVGLQKAMLLVPTCFLISGVSFFFAERALAADKAAKVLPSNCPASLES